MAGLLDLLNARLGDDAARQLGARLGTDSGTTGSAITAALPLLIGALAKNASSPDGAQQLHDALARDHDGSALDRSAADQTSGDGDAILGHVLGNRRDLAERGISQASGLDLAKVGPLLTMLAPLVMVALGRQRREGGLGPGDLASMLGGERDRIGAATPGMLGTLAQLLDRDRDGSIADDVGGMLGGLFGKR
jgi:hypothetical protein